MILNIPTRAGVSNVKLVGCKWPTKAFYLAHFIISSPSAASVKALEGQDGKRPQNTRNAKRKGADQEGDAAQVLG